MFRFAYYGVDSIVDSSTTFFESQNLLSANIYYVSFLCISIDTSFLFTGIVVFGTTISGRKEF